MTTNQLTYNNLMEQAKQNEKQAEYWKSQELLNEQQRKTSAAQEAYATEQAAYTQKQTEISGQANARSWISTGLNVIKDVLSFFF